VTLNSRVVVGRQAIQDRGAVVVGYELLFRASEHHKTSASNTGFSSDEMTAEVLFGALSIGLDHLAEGKLLFCNADRGVLLGDIPITLPPDQTVIEILETVDPNDEILLGCQRLIDQGYMLALDDFVWFDGAPVLLALASIVKIDIQAVPREDLASFADRCRAFDVRLLAEKVETEAELALCHSLGFDLYQGYLLERPEIVSGRTIEASQLARLRSAIALIGEDLDFEELTQLLRTDPGLAYQVMQLASLGRIGETRRSVNTIRDALVVAGSQRVQSWITLLLARPIQDAADGSFGQALMRARACEILATDLDANASSVAFAAGLLSALDLIFGISRAELVDSLQLGPRLSDAAFGDESELAHIVQDATDYQLAAPDRRRSSRLSERDLDEAFAQAFTWSAHVSEALAAPLGRWS
jgi:c-di-GMP phosphodiesterase